MATEAQHVAKAMLNQSVSRGLNTTNQVDWKVVSAFYMALHFVEAKIVQTKEFSTDHRSRAANIRKIPALRPIVARYETVRNFADQARYDAALVTDPHDAQKICDLAEEIKTILGY